ncbi:HD domain-containing protein [Methanoculleus sp. FWC-SCC3]|uniref:HD domain-containing protein n=1 Tax=Methanoculleus methanifontis TaxID=2584086 RepID=A0ABT8M0W1_9EURY|nr:HD domain-containing protein [Methanoculleus sp. FWC-SCC3]
MQVAPAVLLLRPFTPNGAHVPALRPVAFGPTHSHATAAVMRKAAEHLGEDAATWEVIGLLHDIVGGDKERHGVEGYRILIENGVSEEIADIVRRHNHMLFGDYVRPVEVVLQAADSASGLIIACALVKGGAIDEVTPRTVKKKFKEKSFAAGCERERIRMIEPLMDLETFYRIAIEGLTEGRGDLDLG